MTDNGQALCAVRNEDKGFRAAKKFFEMENGRWRSVGCRFGAQRRIGARHCSAERLPVAVPCGAKRRMAPQHLATRTKVPYSQL